MKLELTFGFISKDSGLISNNTLFLKNKDVFIPNLPQDLFPGVAQILSATSFFAP